MKETELLDSPEKYCEAFTVPFTVGDGLEVDSFTEFRQILSDDREAWSKVDSAPKIDSMIFADTRSATVSVSYLYD